MVRRSSCAAAVAIAAVGALGSMSRSASATPVTFAQFTEIAPPLSAAPQDFVYNTGTGNPIPFTFNSADTVTGVPIDFKFVDNVTGLPQGDQLAHLILLSQTTSPAVVTSTTSVQNFNQPQSDTLIIKRDSDGANLLTVTSFQGNMFLTGSNFGQVSPPNITSGSFDSTAATVTSDFFTIPAGGNSDFAMALTSTILNVSRTGFTAAGAGTFDGNPIIGNVLPEPVTLGPLVFAAAMLVTRRRRSH